MQNAIAIQTNVMSEQVIQRHQMYANVHKGLRAFMCETLVNVGCMDDTDKQDITDVLAQVRSLLMICKSHLKHENKFIHTALEARRPGASAHTENDHLQHERALSQLEQSIQRIESASDVFRPMAIIDLYRQLALFIAENFEHMHVEEIDNMQALWESYIDSELMDIEHQLVASIPPEQHAIFMRWMLPHLNPVERAALIQGIRQDAPSQVYENIMSMLQQTLSPRDWAKLTAAIN